MAAVEELKVAGGASTTAAVAQPKVAGAKNDVVEEKSIVPAPQPQEKVEETKALVVAAQETSDPPLKKALGGSVDRDVALAGVEKEKRLSLIKAWEDNEKSKVGNKAQKKFSAVAAWENSKKAALEAKLKKKEEQLEKKKADYAEKMKNKVALVHKQAEEKRAMLEAKRGEEILRAEEMAAKFRATGKGPNRFLACLGY
ncbi:hypothetical protein NMG60_11029074 [Bertholletia excelsa]